MSVGGGSKAKALQACLISITAARWNGAISDQKKRVYLRKQVAGAKSSRYIILLKVKYVCRLDQITVTMALCRVFYSLSLSMLSIYYLCFYINQFDIALNIEYTFNVCLFSC